MLALTGIPLIAIPLPLIMNKFTSLYKQKNMEEQMEKRAVILCKERAVDKEREARIANQQRRSMGSAAETVELLEKQRNIHKWMSQESALPKTDERPNSE